MNANPVPLAMPRSCIEGAIRCEKNLACLDGGPRCQVTAPLNSAEALLVVCHEPRPCAYKTGHYIVHGVEHAVCSCPLRVAFYRLCSI